METAGSRSKERMQLTTKYGYSWQQKQRKKAANNKMETAGSRSRERRRLTKKWRQLAAGAEKEGG